MTTRAPLHCRTFIDNEFRPGTNGLERRNPATDELVAVADVADEAIVDAAVGAAIAAFATWGTTTGFERGHLLRELARVALDRLDDLAVSMTLEMGKPLDEARGEVRKFGQAMRFYAEEAERIGGETIPNESNEFLSIVRKEPVGPVAAITPWNYPVELIGWKLGGALGAGCTVVLKPSEYTPGAAALGRVQVERTFTPDPVSQERYDVVFAAHSRLHEALTDVYALVASAKEAADA